MNFQPQHPHGLTIEELSRALEETADSVMICDAEGRIKFVNQAFERLTGYSFREVRGRTPRLLYSGLMPTEFYRDFWATILAGKVFRGEFINRARDGRLYTEEKNVTPLPGEDGKLVGYVSTGRDITARKRVQAELDARAAQQRVLAEIAQQALDTKDVGGVERAASVALTAVLQADYASVFERLGDGTALLLTAQNGEEEREPRPRMFALDPASATALAMEQGQTRMWHRYPVTRMAPEDALLHRPDVVSSVTVPIQSDHRPLGVLLVEWRRWRELTQQEIHFLDAMCGILGSALRRRRDEEALRSSEERYRNLCEGANDIIWTGDLEGRFTSLNRAGEQALGYSSAEFCQLRLADVLAPEERKLVAQGLLSGPRQGHGLWQLELLNRAGQHIPVEASLRPFLHGDQVVGVQAIARDTSERRRLEEQLRHAQKMEAIGTLAGGIAHDFNNLLTVILGNAELLTLHSEFSPKARNSLQEIIQASERAASLTRQLLIFSRRQTVIPQALDLNHTVAGMVTMLMRVVGEQNNIELNLQQDLDQVRADPGQIEQVLLNLVINARDAILSCGQILITTMNLHVGGEAQTIWPVEPGHYVVLQVSDTGEGIAPELKARIFEPFFTTKGIGKGSGLGLSTVYGIVRQTGGSIWVESNPGHGATFNVCLPALFPLPTSGP